MTQPENDDRDRPQLDEIPVDEPWIVDKVFGRIRRHTRMRRVSITDDVEVTAALEEVARRLQQAKLVEGDHAR